MKILITGANGLVATELIHLLLSYKDSYKIYAVSTRPELLKERYEDHSDVVCLSIYDVDKYEDLHFDAVVHCAFARSKDASQIALSLQYTEHLLQCVRNMRPGVFVNISSQSIYGQSNLPLWTEETPADPDYLYALGKYSTELLTTAVLRGGDIKYTNIRLSSVCENARFLNVFVKNALTGQPIRVMGGMQQCSFIDVRDVAMALKTVIDKSPTIDLQVVYNLGTGTTRTILELAEDVKRIVETEQGLKVTIDRKPDDLFQKVGMDNTLFCDTFKWTPCFDYDDMVRSLIALNGGGKSLSLRERERYLPVSFRVVYLNENIA